MAAFTRSYSKFSKDLSSRSVGLVVFGCSSQISPSLFSSSAVSSWFIFFLLISAKPTFSVASGGTSRPSPPIKSPPSSDGIFGRLLIVLCVVGFFLGCFLLLMAYLVCFRFNAKGKSKKAINRDQVLPTTHEPVDGSGELSKSAPLDLGKELAWRFGWKEIERAGKNFSWVIGEGGYSTVYLASFSDSTLGALKLYRGSERLNQVFHQELQVLIQVSHKNIVRLLGYCDEREEGVLVFEYVSNGTLHEKLHSKAPPTTPPLPWSLRMSIAFQLAQAIEYLHENCSLQIVHCDIKASNILLDDQFSCKLCDFGSAKMGFSSTVLLSSAKSMMGSPGYADPHYLRTGIISKKTDVYSFGVLILELITGMEAFCEEKGQFLTSIIGSALHEPSKVVEMADARLGGDFDREEAMTMAWISGACLSQQPSLRPSMGEILRTMEEKITRIDFVPGKSKEISKSMV
ncbi:salt tolerance receptor-like cytoplasmic kinase 1 [Aristolochia californica]|uniref:salt tolerance receptor-like cytoplasmic kinase 1 n=1 Tax=Aristolochia californica TaxID=171875 RepID=UPI0035DF2A7A